MGIHTHFTHRATRLWLISGLTALLFLGLWGSLGRIESARAHPMPEAPEAGSLTAGNVITIGVAASLSGAPELGWPQANGVQLAVDEINAGGGLDLGGVSYTLALVSEDGGCDGATGAAAAQALVDAGAALVIGHTCSGSSITGLPFYEAANIAMLSPSSTGAFVTDSGYESAFRVISRDDAQVIALANHLTGVVGYDRAAMMEFNNDWLLGIGDVFANAFTAQGGTITGRHIVTSTADFTATLTTIMAETPDVIFLAKWDGAEGGLASKIAHNLGMTSTPFAWASTAPDKPMLDDYLAAAGAAAEGDYALMAYRHPDDMPGYADFNADYQAAGFAQYGGDATLWGAFAYDAAHIAFKAIDRANSVEPGNIRDEVAKAPDYQGVVGDYYGFEDNGDVIPQWTWLETYVNGAWHKVFLGGVSHPALIKTDGDPFSAATLDGDWSWLNEDPTRWSLSERPGFLALTTSPDGPRNWLVRPIPNGDFDIRTRVIFTPTADFQAAGLLIAEDASNYLSLIRAHCSTAPPDCTGGNGIYFDHVEGGAFMPPNYGYTPGAQGEAYLRLVREGKRYSAYYSEDGALWILIGVHELGAGVDPIQVGLMVSATGAAAEDNHAYFDYFERAEGVHGVYLPIILESGTR
ncbi:MAG: ABC transporter substrate-binding protein [Chloroflexi bacterium]|nr:ABC transporter substrate-binding protein [Chloroflexota bacterium]